MCVSSKSFGTKLPTPLWPSIYQWPWVCRCQSRSDVKIANVITYRPSGE